MGGSFRFQWKTEIQREGPAMSTRKLCSTSDLLKFPCISALNAIYFIVLLYPIIYDYQCDANSHFVIVYNTLRVQEIHCKVYFKLTAIEYKV